MDFSSVTQKKKKKLIFFLPTTCPLWTSWSSLLGMAEV